MNIREIARTWYSREDVAEALYYFMKGRECMALYFNKVERPFILPKPDVLVGSAGDCTSFHASIERYDTDVVIDVKNHKVIGRDLVIDIDTEDTKIPGYKVASVLLYDLLSTLSEIGINNFYVKYSGNRGFHIVFPYEYLPKEVFNVNVQENWQYLYRAFIQLIEDVLRESYVKLFPNLAREIPFEKVIKVDKQVVSPRHMIRVPYSLNEKTGFVSVILPIEALKDFNPYNYATHYKAKVWIPELQKSREFTVLFELAIVNQLFIEREDKIELLSLLSNTSRRRSIKIENEEELYPPCIKNLLKGVEPGMRNNAMFTLIHFFKNAFGKSPEEIYNIITEWNERNKEPLKEREIEYAIQYHSTRTYTTFSCQKMREVFGTLICQPDEICKCIKNPVSYPRVKSKLAKQEIKNEA